MDFPINEQHITIDTAVNSYVTVNVKQNDNKTRFVYITLTNGGAPVEFSKMDTSGIFPVLRLLTPDNRKIWNSEYVSFEGDEIKVELSGNAVSEAGSATANIDIYDSAQEDNLTPSGKLISSICFYVRIYPSAYGDGEIEKQDDYSAIADVIKQANQNADSIAGSVKEAQEAAAAASKSAEAAKTSETNAAASASNAETLAQNAATSANNAANTEATVKGYTDAAKTSEMNAKASETAAATSETNAKTSEANAKTSETNAATSEANAKTSETNAKTSETNASDNATLAKSWVVGGTGTRDGEDDDNAKAYATLAEEKATAASDSATAAKISEDNAKTAEINASTSETNAKTSETAAAKSAAEAKASAESAAQGMKIATSTTVGAVKPDNTSITIDSDGTIHGSSSNDVGLGINESNQLTIKTSATESKVFALDSTLQRIANVLEARNVKVLGS